MSSATPATQQREKPILMSAPMIRALLAGKKTQTRRIVKPQPDERLWAIWERYANQKGNPYGEIGSRLWVRETCERYFMPNLLTGEPTMNACGRYQADQEPVLTPHGQFDICWWYSRKTCPAIHMPRWASRITLEITDVRVERLQDISEEDAKAEGCEPWEFGPEQTMTTGERGAASPYRGGYAVLWDEINDERATWKSNPFVWVLSFAVVQGFPKAVQP